MDNGWTPVYGSKYAAVSVVGGEVLHRALCVGPEELHG